MAWGDGAGLSNGAGALLRKPMHTKMIADMEFTYAGRPLKPGDIFEASDNDAFALRTYRRAHDAADDADPKSASRRYRRRDMQAEDTQ